MEPHEQSFFVPLTDAPIGFGPGGISTAVDQRQTKARGAKAALVARQPVMPQKENPAPKGVSTQGRRQCDLREDRHSAQQLCACCRGVVN
jgi:hypothetical protein